jgi:Sec-independent protein secretion pathway component TatC
MSLGDHLDDLRRRLLWGVLGLVPIAVLAFFFGETLLTFLLAPARAALKAQGQSEIIATEPAEVFGAYMKISIIAAIVVGSPWLIYQFWRFIAPGLYPHERRYVYFLLPLSVVLTASGVVFLFRVVLPLVLAFLVGFGTTLELWKPTSAPLPAGVVLPQVPTLDADPTHPAPGSMWINRTERKLCVAIGMHAATDATTAPLNTPPDASATRPAPVSVLSMDLHQGSGVQQQHRVGAVIGLMLLMLAAFVLTFQAPVIVLLLGWVGLIDVQLIGKYRRHAILVCAVLAAAVMPGDPASMFAMMVPLYLLYELGGLLLRLVPASRLRGKRASDLPESEYHEEGVA